jgi:hypothetical protein
MSEATKAEMIGRRSELLATVVLTRRLNVDVHPLGAHDQGIDLICTIRPDPGEKLHGFLPFGAFVWGTAEALETEEEATRYARSHKKDFNKQLFFMPVIVLLFSMMNDTGYVSWLVRPGKDSDKLYRCKNLVFKQFDIRRLDKMVNSIKKWYQRLEAAIVSTAGESEAPEERPGDDL